MLVHFQYQIEIYEDEKMSWTLGLGLGYLTCATVVGTYYRSCYPLECDNGHTSIYCAMFKAHLNEHYNQAIT